MIAKPAHIPFLRTGRTRYASAHHSEPGRHAQFDERVHLQTPGAPLPACPDGTAWRDFDTSA